MRPSPTSGQPPPWIDPAELAGITVPRRAVTPIQNLPYSADGRHEVQVIFATEETLHRRSWRQVLIQVIGEFCGLGPCWSYQRLFFDQIFGRFFAPHRDTPAWLTIQPQRLTARYRQERQHVLTQTVNQPTIKGEGAKLWEHRLRLGSVKIPCEGLVLSPHPERRIPRTRIAYQIVQRGLLDTRGKFVTEPIWEEWCYLFDPEEDATYVREGKVPSLVGLHTDATGILTAPLISLGRLAVTGRHAEFLVFNLSPEGRVLDFRSTIYPMEYLFISDLNNFNMLKSITTPGHWQRF